MVCPGFSLPSASASSIIFRAILSLMLPVGLKPSSLANMLTAGFGLSLLILTIGVLPMVPRILSFISIFLSVWEVRLFHKFTKNSHNFYYFCMMVVPTNISLAVTANIMTDLTN